MKKLISLILCVVVILTFAVPAFAADAAYNFAEDASMKYTIPQNMILFSDHKPANMQ
ncbi:MAG: hypothetical protein ACLTZF_05040 [Oscillospiraceae bacterium]